MIIMTTGFYTNNNLKIRNLNKSMILAIKKL